MRRVVDITSSVKTCDEKVKRYLHGVETNLEENNNRYGVMA